MDSLDLVSPYLFKYKKRNFPVTDQVLPADLDAPTDLFLITYSKSDTAWMQQVLVKIMEAAHPEWVDDTTNRVLVPWLEDRTLDNPFRESPDPLIFSSHLPPDMLPQGVKDKQVKAVYVWRNPKDVLVSLYHFTHSWVLLETPRSFEDFFQQFLDGNDFGFQGFSVVSQPFTGETQDPLCAGADGNWPERHILQTVSSSLYALSDNY